MTAVIITGKLADAGTVTIRSTPASRAHWL